MRTFLFKDFGDKQTVLKLMVGNCAPIYHLPGNVISATLGLVLVYIKQQPEYDLPSLTRFEQFQKFGQNELGHCPGSSHPLRKRLCTWSEFLFIANCA